MRILIHAGTLYPASTWVYTGYGSEVVAWWLARESAKRNHEAYLISSWQTEPPPGVKFIALPPSYGQIRGFQELVQVHSFFKNIKSSILDAYVIDMSPTLQLHEFAYWYSWRGVGVRNGYDYSKPTSHKRNVVVLSQAVRKLFKEYIPIPFETRAIHYGVPVEEYPFSAMKGNYVLYTGRPHPSKGVDLILKVADKLSNIKFILAWHPTNLDHFDYAYRYLKEAKGKDNVRILMLPSGLEGETVKRQLMAHARLFLQPTIYLEAFGLAMLESLATGTPVVTTTAGATPEFIPDIGGVLVKNRLMLREQAFEWQKHIEDAVDVEELATAVADAYETKWDYVEIRKHVAEKFSIGKMTEEYINALKATEEGGWGC